MVNKQEGKGILSAEITVKEGEKLIYAIYSLQLSKS